MKTRYKVYLKDGPQIRKNPSEQDLQLWDSQGIKYEKLGGYETLTFRDADPELLTSLVETKINMEIYPIKQQHKHQTLLLDKIIKTSDDNYDQILALLEEDDALSKGTRVFAIIGVVLSIIALVKAFCF